jgi:hypothetical protein
MLHNFNWRYGEKLVSCYLEGTLIDWAINVQFADEFATVVNGNGLTFWKMEGKLLSK